MLASFSGRAARSKRSRHPVLFGDETSFGLGASLPGCQPRFEADDAGEPRTVLDSVGLGRAIVLQRRAGDASFVLTGKASSIQRASRVLKAAGLGAGKSRDGFMAAMLLIRIIAPRDPRRQSLRDFARKSKVQRAFVE